MHLVIEYQDDIGLQVGANVVFIAPEDADPAVERQSCRDWIEDYVNQNPQDKLAMGFSVLRVTQNYDIVLDIQIEDV